MTSVQVTSSIWVMSLQVALIKRRAVDLCRVATCLCRMS